MLLWLISSADLVLAENDISVDAVFPEHLLIHRFGDEDRLALPGIGDFICCPVENFSAQRDDFVQHVLGRGADRVGEEQRIPPVVLLFQVSRFSRYSSMERALSKKR